MRKIMVRIKKKTIKREVSKKEFSCISPKFYDVPEHATVLGSEIFNGINRLGEMANILSVGMPNQAIFTGYREVLEAQNTIVKSINDWQSVVAPKVEDFKIATDKINSILSPISGAIVDLGLSAVSANKLFEDGIIKKSNFIDLQKMACASFDVVKGQQSIIISELGKSPNFKSFLEGDNLSSFKMTATGLDAMTRAIPTFPLNIELPSFEVERSRLFLNEPEISEEQVNLDSILSDIDESLIEIRRGCWKTFNAKGPDYIRQASSSMRGLVDELLRNIAPHKFSTRKERIYYAVEFESKKTEHLERMTRAFLETYDNLSAWDHKPMKNDEFVKGVFITIEGCLVSILSERRKLA